MRNIFAFLFLATLSATSFGASESVESAYFTVNTRHFMTLSVTAEPEGMRLTWEDKGPSVRYMVFRSLDYNNGVTKTEGLIASNLSDKFFEDTDKSLEPGRVYYYSVWAVERTGVAWKSYVVPARCQKDFDELYIGSAWVESEVTEHEHDHLLVAGDNVKCTINYGILRKDAGDPWSDPTEAESESGSFEVIGAIAYAVPVNNSKNNSKPQRKEHYLKWGEVDENLLKDLLGSDKDKGKGRVEKLKGTTVDSRSGVDVENQQITIYGKLETGESNGTCKGAHGKYEWHYVCFYKKRFLGGLFWRTRSCSFVQGDQKIFFDRDGEDGTGTWFKEEFPHSPYKEEVEKVPNWFQYWFEDDVFKKESLNFVCEIGYGGPSYRTWIDRRGKRYDEITWGRHRHSPRPQVMLYKEAYVNEGETKTIAGHVIGGVDLRPVVKAAAMLRHEMQHELSDLDNIGMDSDSDRLSDDQEARYSRELNIHLNEGLKDTYGLGLNVDGNLAYYSLEYSEYGDNELVSRIKQSEVERAGNSNNRFVKLDNDYSYPKTAKKMSDLTERRSLLTGVLMSRTAVPSSVKSTSGADNIAFKISDCVVQTDFGKPVSNISFCVSTRLEGLDTCRVYGLLVDEHSNQVAQASAVALAGDGNVTLSFDANDIAESGCRPPYHLSYVSAWTCSDVSWKIAETNLPPELTKITEIENLVLRPIDLRKDDYGESLDTDGLSVYVPVEVRKAGEYSLVGELYTTNGEFVCSSTLAQSFPEGPVRVPLLFDRASLFRSAKFGPYVLQHMVVQRSNEILTSAHAPYVTTKAYAPADFQSPDANLFVCAGTEEFIAPNVGPDGNLGDLVFEFCVSNALECTLGYRVSASLYGTNATFVAAYASSAVYLSNGINRISMPFAAAALRSKGVDGPYWLNSVELVPRSGEVESLTFRPSVQSPAYKASDFAAASVAFSGETARVERADDSLVVAFDYETTRGCSVVAAATLVDTNGNFVARAYSTNTVRRAGNWTAQLEFSWRDLAKENVGGPYRVAYFSLTPQGTGEESVVSDSLEIRDVNWLTPVAQQPIEVPEGVDWDSLFSWRVSAGGAVAVSYLGTNAHDVVVVPSEHDGLPVTQIAANCFKSNLTVKAVVVSDGVVDIGNSAFVYCEALKTVSLPETLERIGKYAFAQCWALEQVHLPDSLREIDVGAFSGAVSLEALWLPVGVLNISDRMCSQCSNLVMVAFPPVATNMGDCAFQYCPKLRSARLPEGIRVLPNGAFYRDLQLEDLVLPTTLEAIANNVVLDNDMLTDLVFPSGVTNVGDWAFSSCKAITNFVFRGPPPAVGRKPFPNDIPACYPLDYQEEWEAEIVDGRWNGLWMFPETLPKRRIDTDVIADEAIFEGEDWLFDWDGIREIQSLRNAPIGDGQQAGMTATLKGAGVIAFDWRTSCEGMAGDGSWRDHAEFLVDGEVVSMRADESLWSRYAFELVGDGDHTVTWRYVKDGSGSAGEDCVWVSDIQFAAISDEETSDELLDESEYNWFYEDTPVQATPENPFEYNPSVTPERATCQVDIQGSIGVLFRSSLQDVILEGVQAGICRVVEAVGLEYAVVTSDGWEMVGNANLTVDEEETVKASFVIDYSTSPATIKYMISGHTLTNAAGASTFVCAAQKTCVESLSAKGSCEIHSWAGKYDVVNADVQQVAPCTETELAAGLDTFQNETFQVSGGGTLVIPSDKIPVGGVNRKLHVDGNSKVRFDLSGSGTTPSVTRLFNGVGGSFVIGDNIQLVVPGEGVERVSKLFVKDGNLEARVAERPTIDDGDGSDSAFTVNADGDSTTASASIGNAVEGFWYGLLTTGVLTSDFVLDPDSVKQCTGTGSLRLESSANANSGSGFYRVSVSAEKP